MRGNPSIRVWRRETKYELWQWWCFVNEPLILFHLLSNLNHVGSGNGRIVQLMLRTFGKSDIPSNLKVQWSKVASNVTILEVYIL